MVAVVSHIKVMSEGVMVNFGVAVNGGGGGGGGNWSYFPFL